MKNFATEYVHFIKFKSAMLNSRNVSFFSVVESILFLKLFHLLLQSRDLDVGCQPCYI